MYFQYVTELYTDNEDHRTTKNRISQWLKKNIGKEGTVREPVGGFDWAWSLTYHSSKDMNDSRGIYFVRPEDQVLFRLTFGIGSGR